jgi:hypothetical protein
VRLLTRRDAPVPGALLEARWVSMWGVVTRYEDIETVLDRVEAIEVATIAIEWARAVVAAPDEA